MRRRAKIDANQPMIVRALRTAGATVVSLAEIGDGCPDLLVGHKGVNYLMEVKDPTRKPSERRLTEDEQQFFDNWRGPVAKVETAEEALRVIA